MKPQVYQSCRAPMSSDRRCSTLVDLLRLQSEKLSSQIAYSTLAEGCEQTSSLTYGDLSRKARAIGAKLQHIKLKGERAILLYPPGLDYLTAFFGCLYAGVIAVPAFPPHVNRKNERLTAIMDDAGAAVALTVSVAKRRAEAYLSLTYEDAAIPVESTDDVPEDLAAEWKEFNPASDELAYLQYTSGSTAAPKGVMITHQNVLSNLAYIDEGFEHGSESVSLTWLPHFHDMGLVDGLLMPLYRGFRGLLMAPASFLQRPILWLEAITKYKATHSGGPNFAYELCVKKTTADQRAGLNLESWAVAYNGAEPVRRDALEQFAEAFQPFGFRSSAFYPAYGLAEATLKVSGGRKSDPPRYCSVVSDALERNKVIITTEDANDARHLVSCGRVRGSTEVLIVDPKTGSESEPGTIGEIWVSGPGVAKGFWNRPDESDQQFRAFTSDTHRGPCLRTGDLGFLRRNELYVTGRLKDLIIIRGRNIYPQDIEVTAGQSHPSLRSGGGAAFAIDAGRHEGVALVHELDARRVEDVDGILAAIRRAVSETHEVQLWSIALVKPGILPRTSSGKAQRKTCRRMFLARQLDAVAEWSLDESEADDAPALSTEYGWDEERNLALQLREVIAEKLALRAADISLDEPLYAYGLDSLASTEIAHAIETKLGLSVQMADLLADKSITGLAADLTGWGPRSSGDRLSEGKGRCEELQYALSRGQEAIWFIHQMDPLSVAYTMAGAVWITAQVDIESLRQAFQALVDRHESLRTTFKEINGGAYQRVSPAAEVCFKFWDAAEWSDEFLNGRVEEESCRPFDLENGPVVRVTLFRSSPDRHVLLVAVHHLVADFWSLSVMIDELGKLYRSNEYARRDDLPNLTASYADYVARQNGMLRSAAGEDHWGYWKGHLDGDLPLLALPIDKERPRVQTYRGGSISFGISAEQMERTKSLATSGQATLFVALLAVFQTLLCKYCGQDDILIGTPTSGRISPDFVGVVGYFVNAVVIRSVIGASDTFLERLARTKQAVIAAFYHQEYPFSEIVRRLNARGDASRSPVFQAMFAFQKSHLDPSGAFAAVSLGDPDASLQAGALPLRGFPIQQRIAQFDVTLTVAECGNEVKASLEYNTDLFERSSIERMAAHFLTLLEQLVSSPYASVSSISYLTEGERRQALGEWGDNSLHQYAFVSIYRTFEGYASSIADAVAVVDAETVLTYGELDARANKLCSYLHSAGVKQEAPVALLLHRSAEMVVALMAVLKSGGAYVPIDPSTPASRIDAILRDVRAALVLGHSSLTHIVANREVEIFQIDRHWAALEDQSNLGAAADIDPEAICYIIYTSGSTGAPKGVAVRHFSLARYIQAARSHYAITREERVLQFASLSFDASADEIYSTLTSGATLVMGDDPASMSAADLVESCRERMITVLPLPTAYWHAAVTLSPAEWASASSVRLVVIGGESASPDKMHQWTTTAGNSIRLVNSYGPTETTIGVTFWSPGGPNGGPSSRVLIGRPIEGSVIRILDIHGQPSSVGVVGEICIGGAGLARGYVSDASKTAEAFLPDPFGEHGGGRVYRSGDMGRFVADGSIECLGRSDRQVKCRGYRVELQEVETALSWRPEVRETAVIAIDDARGNKRLAAYVVLHAGASRNPDRLRASLREILPRFMIPSHFAFLDALPRNAAGKVDRRSLPPVQFEPAAARHPERALSPGFEQQIAEVWSRVLGVASVGPGDNFFDLGGDSILSLQVVAMARECGIAITPKQIFEHPTVAALAAAASAAPSNPTERIPITGPTLLTPIQRWFFECNFEDADHWNMALMLEAHEKLDFDVIAGAWVNLAARHSSLRSTFMAQGGEWGQKLGTGRAPMVREIDLTGLSQSEESTAIQSTIAFEQGGLDVATGPLLRSVLFKTGPGKQDRLLIVAHHLIVDAISLRILIEDIDRFCSALIGERAISPALRRPTAEAGLWAQELERLAASGNLQVELKHWRQLKDVNVSPLPVDFSGANLEATATAIETRLDTVRTAELIRVARQAYHCRVDELLLAALAETLCDWTASDATLLEFERHGREVSEIALDVSESIGWFTAAFPLLIQLGPRSERLDPVRRIKESLRRLPNGGIGFGLLRYLSPDPNLRAEMRALPQPQVSFNYLGNLDASFGRLRFFDSPQILSYGSRSARAARIHLLEVDAGVTNQGLESHWRFSTDVFKPETIKRVADSFAARLAALIERGVAGEPVSFSTYDFPLATLSERQVQRLTQSDPTIQNIYSLSPSQRGMLFHSTYSGEPDVYVGALLLSITGQLEPEPFEQAWQRIISRHSIFRTSFAWEELAEPLQIVHANARLSLRRLAWTDIPEESAVERLQELAGEERLRGFDLSTPPLMGVVLIRVSDERHLLALTLHHLIIDGWSLSMLFNEIFSAYDVMLKGTGALETDQARSFDSYIAWLQQQDRKAAESFWREELRGVSGSRPLPIQRAASAGAPPEVACHRRVHLSASLTCRLASFARQNRLTLNTVLQGAWARLLSRYSGEADVIFGHVTAGRPPSLPDSERIIGPFAVTLPTRARLSRDRPLGLWLQDLQDRQADARRFEYCSLIDIQGWSEVAHGRPMFDSVIAFENYPLDRDSIGSGSGLKIELIESLESTNYPLTVIVFPENRLSIDILYRSNHFEDSAIERLLGHFEALLTGFPNSVNQPVFAVPMLTEGERRQLLGLWSGHATYYPRDKTIAALFLEQVDRVPDSVAVAFGEHQVSYAELHGRAGAAAAVLASRGVCPETIVGLSTERSIETIIGILAIVRSGAAYLPLELSYPVERIRLMLTDSGAKVVLTSLPIEAVAQEPSVEMLSLAGILDRALALSSGREDGNRQAVGEDLARPENLAYVIYTSGSTGTPKGVGITNRGVVRLVKQTNYFDFGEQEVFLQFSPLAFDASTFEIWGALLNGARLVIMPPETPEPAQIGSALKDHQVTVAWFTAGLFHLLAQDRPEAFSSVSHVLAGGDVIDAQDVRALFTHAPSCTLINGYGPTESTTFTTSYKCDDGTLDRTGLPIGRPISNTFVYIMDEELNVAPQGLPGELYIGGDGLARCYIGAPELTAERFLPNPVGAENGQRLYRSGDFARLLPDGNIEFLGRRDRQVKIRGFRIEPGEVESAIAAHPQVRQCAVVPCGEGPGDKRLVAYLAAATGQTIEAGEIRGFLRARLPDYMTPAEFVFMDALPLTPNGKVDRQSLLAPDGRPPDVAVSHVAPRNAVEEVLAGIWKESLARDSVGVTDDFFALGGHSLAAMRVTSAIRYIFRTDLTVAKIFESPTVEALAREIRAVETKPGQMERIARVVQRIKNMSPEEKAEKLQAKSRHTV